MRRRLGFVGLIIGAVLVVAGCGSDDSDDGGGGDQEFTIGYAPPVLANPAIQALADGIEVQADSLGDEVVIAGGEFDPSKQLAAMDTLIQRNVDAILVWPLDPNGIQPALQRASEADIPVLVQDSPNAAPFISNFQVNDYESAREAATFMAEKLGTDCKVTIIEGIPQVEVLAARNQGLADGAEEAGCEVLDKQVNAVDSADGARPIVDAWKSQFGAELGGILAYNDPSAVGAASAVDGSFKPLITGINGDSEGIAAVSDGRILATFDLRTPEIGNGMAWAAHQILTGDGEIPETVNVEMVRIDESNVAEYVANEERLKGPMEVSIVDRDGESFLEATP